MSLRFSIRRVAIYLSVLTVATVSAWSWGAAAGAAAAPAAGGAPTEAASASVVSLKKLADEANSLGIDLPPFLTVKGLGNQFVFLGPEGIDPDQTIGAVVFTRPGWDMTKGQGMVFVLPARPGAAPLSNFTAAGAMPVEGHADTVVLNGVGFRRTAHHLIFSPTLDAVTAVDPSKLSVGLNAPKTAKPTDGPIARLVVDLGAVRLGQPEQYQAMFEGWRHHTPPAANDAQQAGQDFAFNLARSLDRVELMVGRRASDLEVGLIVTPVALPKPAGTFQKPGMPAGVVGRYDVSVPAEQLVPSLDKLIEPFAKAVHEQTESKLTPDDQRLIASWVRDVIKAPLSSKALSVGIEPQRDAFIVYMVQQQPQPDFEAHVRKLADQFNGFAAKLDKPPEHSSVAISHYMLGGGADVMRLTMLDRDKPQGYVDLAARDGKEYIAFATDSAHHIEGLMNAPASVGPMKGLASGEADLQKLIAAMKVSPDHPLSFLSADRLSELEHAAKGRMLTIRAEVEGNGIAFRVGLPKDVLKVLLDMAQGK